MKILKKLFGLLVDDGRLAWILCVGLAVAIGLRLVHQPMWSAVAIWVGLILSLWISVDHQRRLKQKR